MAPPAVDFQKMFNALPAPYMVLDTELRFIDMNERYLQTTQRTREDLLGRYVFDAFPESGERLAMFKRAFERAVAGEANAIVKKPFSIPRPQAEGGGMREVWWTCHHQPIHDLEGNVCGMVQQALDVTREVTAERMRDVVVREFDHRVKNHLSTIIAIARRTARSSVSTEAFIADFEARVNAMARTHQLLVHGGRDGMTLADLLESELSPYRQDGQRRIVAAGPPIELTGKQGQALGMALHELATNAAKHGALRDPHAKLEVRWSSDPATGRVTIVWHEDGLRAVAEPAATGFGTTIIEHVLPSELSGSVDRRFLPSGLRCTISFPANTPHGAPLKDAS